MIEIDEETFCLRGEGCLFPREIDEDPWVLYHGTSSLYEAQIDARGLTSASALFTKADVEKVLDVFRRLRWSGSSGRSRAVLEPYSANYDLSQARGRPIYLTEDAARAVRYATKQLAGGEIASTIRCCFAELGEYLADPEVRKEHLAYQELDWNDAISTGRALPHPPTECDLGGLAADLESLGELRERAARLFREHEYGLVYAVRIMDAQVPDLGGRLGMGIMAFKPLGPDGLVAKARVPPSHEWEPAAANPERMQSRLESGVLAAILARSNRTT